MTEEEELELMDMDRQRRARAAKAKAGARVLSMQSTMQAANRPPPTLLGMTPEERMALPAVGGFPGLPIPRDESGKITTPLAELLKLAKKNIKFGELYRYGDNEPRRQP